MLFARVLVGWDGSHAAAAGLRMACALTAFQGGSVTALAVVPAFAHLETDDDRARARTGAQRPLQAEYESIVESLSLRPEQRVTLRFLEDDRVGTALEHYAAEELADLLIVGLHGREGILHPRMGHIANHVVKSGCCPVLVIPETPAPGSRHVDEPSHLGSVVKGLFHPGRHHSAAV